MLRVQALSRQVCPAAEASDADFDGHCSRATAPLYPVVTSGSPASDLAKVHPPGKKHFVTNPWERLARYQGDGGPTLARTIPTVFREKVRSMGQVNCLAQKRGARDGPWTMWTWADYEVEATRVAKSLIALGCAQFEAINILAFNSPEWYFTAVGAVLAGLTPAGIYNTNASEAVEYILDHSKCKVLFVDSDVQLKKVIHIRDRCKFLKAIVHWGPDCPEPGTVPDIYSWQDFIKLGESTPDRLSRKVTENQYPDNACYLSYTSGTTGHPKAVMYSHDNIIWSFTHLMKYIMGNASTIGLNEREVSYMPLSHIAGNFQLFGAFVTPPTFNSCLYFAFPDAMQGSLVVTLKEVKPTLLLAVPRVWEKLAAGLQQALAAKPELKQSPVALRALVGLDQVKASTTGAAPISKELMEFWDSIGVPIYEIYGMTENAAYSHFNYSGCRRISSVGHALVDEGAGSKIAEGTGEICTWSRGVMMGYMYMPDKTDETFDDEGYLRTGDVGMVDSDGFTHITGRIKELIITAGGENCAPVLLEEAIKAKLPAVSNAVIIGDKQKYLIALLTLKLKPDDKGGFTNELAAEATEVDPECKTFQEAYISDKWQKYIAAGIAAANKVAISRAQQTRKYGLVFGDFSPVGKLPELTPTMKLRREVVRMKYLGFIRRIYGDDFLAF